MRSRPARFLLLAFLLIVGSAAAVFTAYLARRVEDLGQAGQAMAARIDALLTAVQKIGDTQQAYVVPRPTVRLTPEQVPALIESVVNDANDIARQVHAENSGELLKRFVDSAHSLGQVEQQAQEHLRLGQDLLAADVISVQAREALASMTSALRDLRSVESAAIEADRLATLRQALFAIGGAAAVWSVGLLALVSVPRARPVAQLETPAPAILSLSAPQPAPRPVASPSTKDFVSAADVCTAIGRLTDSRDLPSLLTQAAAALGASGVVVWMAAGEELIAASAHGYDAKALTRIGRIHRASLNATAGAWRLGAMQIVPGDESSRGALAAPMWGTDRCVGVLAVEVAPGREHDETTQAITRLLAAQLAATLAPWPASSVADAQTTPLEKVAEA